MGVYDLDTAKQKVTDYATQKWGRGPQNEQEWGAVGQGINYGDGVDDNELNQAYGNADSYAQSLGAQQVGQQQAPAPAPAPASNQQPAAGQVSPAVAQQMPSLASSFGQQQAAPASPIQQAFQTSLLSQLAPKPMPTLDDPNIAPKVDAFRVSQQRNAERQQSQAAERLTQQGMASGGSGGALDTAIQQIGAQRGLNESNYNAGLIGDELTARRNEMQQALSLAAASGDAEASRGLQRELATLDAALRERGIDLQADLGQKDIDLRTEAIDQQGSLGRGDLALRLLLGLQGNELAYDQMGLGASQWLANFNQNNFMDYMNGFGG